MEKGSVNLTAMISALNQLKLGYQCGIYRGQRWRVTLSGDAGERVRKLYGECLRGGDHVSFNLYALADGWHLKPCEMPAQKVVDFVLGFVPEM